MANYSKINSDFGKAMALMSHSNLHNATSLKATYIMVMPAIVLGQYLIMEDNNEGIVGYVSWAKFSTEAEQKYLDDPRKLELSDWNSGTRVWVIDFICLAGKDSVNKLMHTLRHQIFANDIVRAIRLKADKTRRRTLVYKGVNAANLALS